MGRAAVRLVLVVFGYLIGKKVSKQKPIDKSFPKKPK